MTEWTYLGSIDFRYVSVPGPACVNDKRDHPHPPGGASVTGVNVGLTDEEGQTCE
jgi:hypothetical protein